ncbi:MAG: hypothetical protein QGG84_02855 [Rhodospirillales bacterium]|nr:hypothetical protein [Rhodospirillales bacterium]
MESGTLITVDIVDGIGLVLYISQSKDYVKILKLVILFAGMAAISMVIIFQLWQYPKKSRVWRLMPTAI